MTEPAREALDGVLADLPPASEAQGGRPDAAGEMARAIRALTLRTNGATWQQVADRMGYADQSGPRHLVNGVLARREAENVSELRDLENARLDRDEQVLAAVISGVVQEVRLDTDGRAVTDADGRPVYTVRVPSLTERLRAVDARTRLSARRSRMNGLDAPVAVQISAGVGAELDDALAAAAQLLDTIVGETIAVHDEPPPRLAE